MREGDSKNAMTNMKLTALFIVAAAAIVPACVASPPRTPQAPRAAASQNRPPSVRARCEPCTVEVGKSSTVTVDATDPDGDALTYRWTAAAGSLSAAADRQSQWTAPMQEGPAVVVVEVRDPRGASATDALTIQVIRPAVKELGLEDVHVDFERYSRDEMRRLNLRTALAVRLQ